MAAGETPNSWPVLTGDAAQATAGPVKTACCNSHSGCSVTLLNTRAGMAPLYNSAPFTCKVGMLLLASLQGGLHNHGPGSAQRKAGKSPLTKRCQDFQTSLNLRPEM